MLASIPDDDTLRVIALENTVQAWAFVVAVSLFWCLVLWLIIYTAVRSALSVHRRRLADDDAFARQMAAQRHR